MGKWSAQRTISRKNGQTPPRSFYRNAQLLAAAPIAGIYH